MKIIAHRGLTTGPNKLLENRPDHIKSLLKKGIDCEIDIRLIDGGWYLGHDTPDYPVDYIFLEQQGLWIHAKNLEALYVLSRNTKLNFFWHQEDDYTLTSHGYIWTYPGKQLTLNSIAVMPEWNDITLHNVKTLDCFGVCTDYVEKLI